MTNISGHKVTFDNCFHYIFKKILIYNLKNCSKMLIAFIILQKQRYGKHLTKEDQIFGCDLLNVNAGFCQDLAGNEL